MARNGQKTQGVVQRLRIGKPSPQLVPLSSLYSHSICKSYWYHCTAPMAGKSNKTNNTTCVSTALIKPASEGNHIAILQVTY